MKKWSVSLILVFCFALLAGCGGEKAEGTVGLANPWVEYATREEAEAAVGFAFSIPDTVANTYAAEVYRVMNDQLMEVTYRDESFEVVVRQQLGEGQDISGDYRAYETVKEFVGDDWTNTLKYNEDEVLNLVSCGGYSYSLYAPNGYWGDSAVEFGFYLIGEK